MNFNQARGLLLAIALCISGIQSALAVVPDHGEIVQVPTRGATLPFYVVWQPDATATVILFSGGDGGYGTIGSDGWPTNPNFLIRSGKLFAAQGLNVVMVGSVSDKRGLDFGDRVEDWHVQDNLAVLRQVRAMSPVPVWIVGTSRGTISVTATAIADAQHLASGVVLTSVLTHYGKQGTPAQQHVSSITVPVLMVQHKNDECKWCPSNELSWLVNGLTNVPVKKVVLMEGGENLANGNPCGNQHSHGFIGIEKSTVSTISDWINYPSN